MHNYFILRAGGKTERAENGVLPAFTTAFTGETYLDSMVLTAGERRFVAKAVRVAGCFDPQSDPFARYTARFDDAEMDGLSITGASIATSNGEKLINFASFSGATAKEVGEPLDVECTLYLNLQANGVRLLGGENPLYPWLLGEKRGAKWSLYPIARADVLSTVTSLPTHGRINLEVETVGNAIVFTAENIPQDFSAVALLCDGVAVLTYETTNEGREFEYFTFFPTADAIFLDEPLYSYRTEVVTADEGCQNPSAVSHRPFGFVVGSNHPFSATLFPSDDSKVICGDKKFAFLSGTSVELFYGIAESTLPVTMEFGQTVTAAAFGGDDFLLVALKDGSILLFDITDVKPFKMLTFDSLPGVCSVAISPNAEKILFALSNGYVNECEIIQNQIKPVFVDGRGGLVALDGKNMTAVRYEDGVLSEYAYDHGAQKIRTIAEVDGYFTSLHVYGNIVDLKTAFHQRVLVEKGTGTTTQFDGATEDVRLSPCGTYIAVMANSGVTTLSVYDGEFGELIATEAQFPLGASVFPVRGAAIYRTGEEIFALPILEECRFLVFPSTHGETEYRVIAEEKGISERLTLSFCAVV